MRVLLVSHRFPPEHTAGTERYAEALARDLVGAGHAVEVFTATKDVGRRDLTLDREERSDGLVAHTLVQNLYHERFEETWRNPGVEARFAEVLAAARPDVVHFHHLLYLSLGLVAVIISIFCPQRTSTSSWIAPARERPLTERW